MAGTPVASGYDRDYVLRTPEWPLGVCALHMGEEVRCSSSCMHRRLQFAEAARALSDYFERCYTSTGKRRSAPA